MSALVRPKELREWSSWMISQLVAEGKEAQERWLAQRERSEQARKKRREALEGGEAEGFDPI